MAAQVREIEIPEVGAPSTPLGVFDEGPTTQLPSQMARIIELIESTEATDLVEINRLIAREIAITLANTNTMWNNRITAEKIKALRELAKTLQEGDNLAKKDFLNFDGPKFRYVLGELVQVFKSSLKSAGQSEDTVNHILRVFRGQLSQREPDLRRETERVTEESIFTSVMQPAASAEGTNP